MTPRERKALEQYWWEGAQSDAASVTWLVKGRRWLQALFFCHLALEKALKAVVVKHTTIHPPHVHNLVYLAGKTQLVLTKAQVQFLETVNRFNIEGRYPSYQRKLAQQLDRRVVEGYFRATKDFIAWCQKNS